MGRWEPNARARLERAALELYHERGYQQTTVADISQRAGLTERTFFRHFTDKREVLFGRSHFVDAAASAVSEAPAEASPLDAVRAGLEALSEILRDRHAPARLRREIIYANAELREREAMKLTALATALAAALRARNVDSATAHLTAELGVVAFKVAFEQWLDADEPPAFQALYEKIFQELAGLVASKNPSSVAG